MSTEGNQVSYSIFDRISSKLDATRNAAQQAPDTGALHDRLGRGLDSLRRRDHHFVPPSEDAVLRMCVAAAEGNLTNDLRDEAMLVYQEQPDDYDLVLSDLISDGFRRWARGNLANRKYFLNENTTAEGDFDAFLTLQQSTASQSQGMSTGLPSLDTKLGGLRGLTFLAGDKGVGKTSLALQMIVAALRGDPQLCVLLYMLDTSKTLVYERLLCLIADVEYRWLHSSDKPEDISARIEQAKAEFRESIAPRIRVVERDFEYERESYDEDSRVVRKGLTAASVRVACEQLQRNSRCIKCMLLFDLFQKIVPHGEIADSAARDHYRLDLLNEVKIESANPRQPNGYPVLVTCETRKDTHKTGLNRDDLKGDGRIASDADVVMLVSVNAAKGSASESIVPTTLRIDKGREGVTRGDVPLWFEHQKFLFHDTKPTAVADHRAPGSTAAWPMERNPSSPNPLPE